MKIHRFCHPRERFSVPYLDAIKLEGVEPQFHPQSSQRERHFIEPLVDAYGAVLAHGPFHPRVEERVQVNAGDINPAYAIKLLEVPGLGRHPGGLMHPLVIGGLDPERELLVQLLDTGYLVAHDRKGAFKTVLYRLDHPFDLPLAPRMVGLGMQEPDAQVGADHLGMLIDKGLALVGVELDGHAPALYPLAQGIEECRRIGVGVVACKGDDPGGIIDQYAKLGTMHFTIGRAYRRPRGEVHHPQVVDKSAFERLLRPRLQPPGLQALAVMAVTGKVAVGRAQRRQLPPLTLPVRIKHLEWDFRVGDDLLDQPAAHLTVDRTGRPPVATAIDRQAAKPLALVVVPPVLKGAYRVAPPGLIRPGAQGGIPQCRRQPYAPSHLFLDTAHDLEPGQGHRHMFIFLFCFHAPKTARYPRPVNTATFCGKLLLATPPGCDSQTLRPSLARASNAGKDKDMSRMS